MARIVAIRASLNRGLTDDLKAAFPNIVPVERPPVKNQRIDPNWLAGFTSGEGCFQVIVKPFKTMTLGFQVFLVFQLTQHYRDEQLLRSLAKLLKCGKVYKDRDAFNFRVQKFIHINEIIIPFFKTNKIIGVKHLDFLDFCKVAELMKSGAHLTPNGLENIRKIKAGMNKGIN